VTDLPNQEFVLKIRELQLEKKQHPNIISMAWKYPALL
jgi:hypothetical protein